MEKRRSPSGFGGFYYPSPSPRLSLCNKKTKSKKDDCSIMGIAPLL